MTKLHIFDVDGTILDSMRMWDNVVPLSMKDLGIEPDPDLASIIDPMTMPEAMEYIADRYKISGGPSAVKECMDKFLIDQYTNKLQLFDGILEDLDQVQKTGETMIVFSNTPHMYLDHAIRRTGIGSYFQAIYTVEDIHHRKDTSAAFRAVCDIYHVDPSEATVYEDSPFAIKAAREAGCTVKVYDRYR